MTLNDWKLKLNIFEKVLRNQFQKPLLICNLARVELHLWMVR